MKIAVLTALCGNRETLVDPLIVFEGVDYYAFVDRKWEECKVWKQHPIVHFSSDSKFAARRNAKPYKIMPHLFVPGYDVYIWHDVSHALVTNPFNICETYLKTSDVAIFRHTQRNCIYEEAKVLKEIGYDHVDLIDAQVSYYKSKGYPDNNGLYELPVSIRANTEKTQIMNMKWWENICKYSSRDQLSFPFSLWETGIVPNILPGFANGYNSSGTIGNNSILPQVRHHVGSGG